MESDQPAAGAGPDTQAGSVRLLAAAMLRTGGWFGSVAAVGSLVVAGVLAGGPGLAGAGVGAGIAFASSLLTLGLMARAARRLEAALGLVMGGYILKMAGLLVAVPVLQRIEQLHLLSLGLALLAVAAAWAVAGVVAFQRTKLPTVILTHP